MSDSKGCAFNHSAKELITSKLKINAKENGNKEWSLGILTQTVQNQEEKQAIEEGAQECKKSGKKKNTQLSKKEERITRE